MNPPLPGQSSESKPGRCLQAPGWRRLRAVGAAALCGLLLSACVSTTNRSIDVRPATPLAKDQVPAQALALRLGVAVFDANVPGDYEEMLAEGIIPEVRKAEASFLPYALKSELQRSGQWAEVRVLPRLSNAIDVTLVGKIEGSDGEHLSLTLSATDSTGRNWFTKKYDGFTSKYAYDPVVPSSIDPFRDIYRQIDQDLTQYYRSMTPEQIRAIKRVAELKFANEMAPEAFAEYLKVDKAGAIEVRRLPADNDPMVERIQRVREREFQFINALDEHYANFNAAMLDPYQRYRHASYDAAASRRQLLEEARNRTIAGAAAVVGGMATAIKSENSYGRVSGISGVGTGAALLKSGFDRRANARLQADALVELGTSLDAEVTPHVLALESETLTLSGNVDEQYKALRTALARAWRRDLGLPVLKANENADENADANPDANAPANADAADALPPATAPP